MTLPSFLHPMDWCTYFFASLQSNHLFGCTEKKKPNYALDKKIVWNKFKLSSRIIWCPTCKMWTVRSVIPTWHSSIIPCRGADWLKHKHWITITLCINDDGNHICWLFCWASMFPDQPSLSSEARVFAMEELMDGFGRLWMLGSLMAWQSAKFRCYRGHAADYGGGGTDSP